MEKTNLAVEKLMIPKKLQECLILSVKDKAGEERRGDARSPFRGRSGSWNGLIEVENRNTEGILEPLWV